MVKLTIPKGDTGYDQPFVVQNADGTVFDLGEYTITLKVWAYRIPGTLKINQACTPDDVDAGTCHYTVQDGDFDTVGRFTAELELTRNGVKVSTEPFRITVQESG